MEKKEKVPLVTLISLIVVLVVFIIIGLQSVLPMSSNARMDAFRVEATDIIKASKDFADSYLQNEVNLTNDGKSCKENNTICVTVEKLVELNLSDAPSDYTGKVLIDISNSDEYKYNLYLQKASEFNITDGIESDYVKNGDIKDGGFAGKTTEYTTCECN